MKQKHINQSGFSIIEILTTISLVVVAFLLFYVSSNSIAINRSGRHKEVALRIADQKMQSLRTTAFSSLPSSGTFSDTLMSSLPSGSGTVTVTDVSATLKNVTVTVTWKNSKGIDQEVELNTYITEGGLGQ